MIINYDKLPDTIKAKVIDILNSSDTLSKVISNDYEQVTMLGDPCIVYEDDNTKLHITCEICTSGSITSLDVIKIISNCGETIVIENLDDISNIDNGISEIIIHSSRYMVFCNISNVA